MSNKRVVANLGKVFQKKNPLGEIGKHIKFKT